MLAGDVVALYYQGDKYSKVTGDIDYSHIYNNGKYSFIYVQAEKGQPEVLYYGGMKFAKIVQATNVSRASVEIKREFVSRYVDYDNTYREGTTYGVQEVTWARDVAKLENGETYKTPWKVVSGDPNFSSFSYPYEYGYTKPRDEPAIYVNPDNISSYRTYTKPRDGALYLVLDDGIYLKND